MPVYYNEWEPYAAEWLRNLIKAGHLPEGDVDERDIRNIAGDDLKGYSQCHFFAGIGGWPLALRMAGWPDDRPVWTGSCPCQDFSSAGLRKARSGERHLWPIWASLIEKCRPPELFGEQVRDAIAYGWLDEVAHDLEGCGYAVAAAVLPAFSVGARHRRLRLYICASNSERKLLQGWQISRQKETERPEKLDDEQFSRFCQSHAWPTLSDSELWAGRHGIPRDVGVAKANKAIGNAIVPQVAAEFIKAYMQCLGGHHL